MTFLFHIWQTYLLPSLRFLRRHLKASVAALVVVMIVWGVYAVTRPSKPVFVTAVATRGDLRQTVEAVGTVISEKDLALQFPTSDVVSGVFVKEGQKVVAGQTLATLRSGSLSAGLSSASASVQSAKAALQALEEGSRPEDITIAEASVAYKRASLQAVRQTLVSSEENLKISQDKLTTLKAEADIALSGLVSTAGSTISQQLALSKTALLTVQGVLNANDVNDAIIKNSPGGYTLFLSTLQRALTDVEVQQMSGSPTQYLDALQKYAQARKVIASAAETTSRGYDIISSLPLTSYFTNTSKETNKSTIATQKSYAQGALTAIDTASNALQDASATYDTRIATQQSEIVSLQGSRDRAKSDIATYETSLLIDQAQLDLKKAPARQTDLDAARARVRQAQADWSRAAALLRDTVLVAPVDGVVTKVHVKTGEIRPSTEPSVTMLGDSPYRVEVFVSEVDIPRIQISQTGSITLDAFRSDPFSLRVSEIDVTSTDKDGVPKYRVKLDFVDAKLSLKVGMTGDAEVTTGFSKNVVSIPIRSVVKKDDGTSVVRVLQKDADTYEERLVDTGIDGEGGLVEVKGIDEGEVVIVLIKSS